VAAFSAILASGPDHAAEDWSSLVALHGMLAAHGLDEQAVQLVDSAIAGGLDPALGLLVIDASAGLDIGERASGFIAQLANDLAARGSRSLWLLTHWYARRSDVAQLGHINAMLEARAAMPTGQRLDSLIAGISGAYLALARHDTADALRRFGELQPTARGTDIASVLWESLAPERMQYARLLLAKGDAAGAHRVATSFDLPGVLIHQLFLLPSLEVRVQAARALGDGALERRALERTAQLRAVAASREKS